MTTIGNIGIGLFILLLLWIGTLIIFVIGVKLQSNLSWIALVLATFITVVLLLFPINKNLLEEEVDINVSKVLKTNYDKFLAIIIFRKRITVSSTKTFCL